jgi:hypothetical protein
MVAVAPEPNRAPRVDLFYDVIPVVALGALL